jgi:hypothetical protein
MNYSDISKEATEDLEIFVRLALVELVKRIGKVNHTNTGPSPYHYASGIVNDQQNDISRRLIRYAYENHGMETARVVYKCFSPARMNPETTIQHMAQRDGWVAGTQNTDSLADLRKAYIADRTISTSSSYTFIELDKKLRKLLNVDPNELF